MRKATPDSTSGTYYAVRTLSIKYLNGEHLGTLRRHSREMLWFWWLHILYSDDKRVSIWLNEVYFGNTEAQQPIYGIERAASEIIGVPLTELSCQQMALLVVITRAPTMYQRRPEMFKDKVEWVAQVCKS